tara:strand:- start:109 stop:339 length:231 start_codon:yes stop_codon:yes gene_type:complete
MNGKGADLDQVARITGAASQVDNVTTLVALSATLIHRGVACSGILNGAQDCHVTTARAHTGGLSVELLADTGPFPL